MTGSDNSSMADTSEVSSLSISTSFSIDFGPETERIRKERPDFVPFGGMLERDWPVLPTKIGNRAFLVPSPE